jgi:rhamnose transport system ATP-binding protein
MTSLSGGNQQKVVLAKWLSRTPSVIIVDEPTRGIDVGTKSEVHRILTELARGGVAVLVISSELPEVLALADRILVMREGRIVAELSGDGANEEQVMAAATGQAHVPAPIEEPVPE